MIQLSKQLNKKDLFTMNPKIKSLILLVGILWISLASPSSKSDYYSEVAKSQKLIMDVYKYTMNNYADKLNLEEFTRASIKNMVGSLDPYTVYLEEEERSSIDMLTKGKYGGVGLQISKKQDKLTVIAPFDDTPAYKAGIQSGDVIWKIDSTFTKKLSSTDAAKLIRGKKGTTVVLHIKRFGFDELIEFPLVRDDIKIKDVAWYGKINDETGYVRLTRFSKNSTSEMKTALEYLVKENSKGIILDLRDNPGGLLQSSINILDMFIPKGDTLLSTKGRIKKSNRSFISNRDPIVPEDVKISVLINNGSASASEIVSGAIQDLDRGLVIGRKSFGKGLVQSVYRLDEKRSLKLTTAKYYIPSGRLIQKEGFLDEEIIEDNEELDSLFYTESGRLVKGGGGISPDLMVEKPEYGPLTIACWRNGLFFSFVQREKHKYHTFEDVVNNHEILSEFSTYTREQKLDINLPGEKLYTDLKEKFNSLDSTNVHLMSAFSHINQFIETKESNLIEEESKELLNRLSIEFANQLNGPKGKFMESFKNDLDVQEAMEVLSNEQAYDHIFSIKNLSE